MNLEETFTYDQLNRLTEVRLGIAQTGAMAYDSIRYTYAGPMFDRGFTGHEHYDRFKTINANARLYDPVVGRFFSPDPFVQIPDFTQSYNRYSYCMNNPVMFYKRCKLTI